MKINLRFLCFGGLPAFASLLFSLSAMAPLTYSQGLPSAKGSYSSGFPGLQYTGREVIPSSKWIKSGLFNTLGTKFYTLNLENMSIDEYDRQDRILLRKFTFMANPATGWNYDKDGPMPSFEEKPVEACFTHDDKILWVSLHNAGGIVAIRMDSLLCSPGKKNYPVKTLKVFDLLKQRTDSISVPFIPTGKTPKVVAKTTDGNFLMVSNWHEGTLSFLSDTDTIAPYARMIRNVKVGPLPRGIYVNSTTGRTFVGLMGGSSIRVINDKTGKIVKTISVLHNPRHIIADCKGRLFVSFNSLSQIACIDPVSGRTLFSSATEAKPRTICLSKDQRYLFVTCYEANKLQVFKINKSSFSLEFSLNCSGKPIGVDLYEDASKLEAWVCTYLEDNLKIFTFSKNGLAN